MVEDDDDTGTPEHGRSPEGMPGEWATNFPSMQGSSFAGSSSGSDLSRYLLSTRAHNVLTRHGYRTGAQVEAATDEELLSLRGFGVAQLREVRRFIGSGDRPGALLRESAPTRGRSAYENSIWVRRARTGS